MAGFIIFPKANNYVEIEDIPFAITKEEQAEGLMWIKEPSFMVFLYKEQCSPNFWMKNTFIPLDIIFVNDGKIKSIKKGKPLDKSTIETDDMCNVVIEAPLGFCKENGIDINDSVKIKYDKDILNKISDCWS